MDLTSIQAALTPPVVTPPPHVLPYSQFNIKYIIFKIKTVFCVKKIVTLLWFFILENNVNVPSFKRYRIEQKNLEKNCFLLASWRSRMKIAGSGSGGYTTLRTTTCKCEYAYNHMKLPYFGQKKGLFLQIYFGSSFGSGSGQKIPDPSRSATLLIDTQALY